MQVFSRNNFASIHPNFFLAATTGMLKPKTTKWLVIPSHILSLLILSWHTSCCSCCFFLHKPIWALLTHLQLLLSLVKAIKLLWLMTFQRVQQPAKVRQLQNCASGDFVWWTKSSPPGCNMVNSTHVAPESTKYKKKYLSLLLQFLSLSWLWSLQRIFWTKTDQYVWDLQLIHPSINV